MKQSQRILVGWFGSLAGHGTVGDLLAVQSVVGALLREGRDVRHLSATSQAGLPPSGLALETLDPADFDTLVFVCGPILRGHPVLDRLVRRFEGRRRIAVGVSLLAAGSPNHAQPFDLVLAREGGPQAYEDVAILAPPAPRPARGGREDGLRIGLALRGRQPEYGEDRCLDRRVRTLADGAVARLRARAPVQVFEIEHHLVRSGRTPAEIEAQYADADLVITSRFHGGVLALRNGTPFIAIDQIAGGAKVSGLLGGASWPHVYRADTVAPETIGEAAATLVREPQSEALAAMADERRQGAQRTLDALSQALDA